MVRSDAVSEVEGGQGVRRRMDRVVSSCGWTSEEGKDKMEQMTGERSREVEAEEVRDGWSRREQESRRGAWRGLSWLGGEGALWPPERLR